MADCNIPEGHTDDKSILTCHTRSSSQAGKRSILNSLISDNVDLALMFSEHLACKVTRRYCHLSGRVGQLKMHHFPIYILEVVG